MKKVQTILIVDDVKENIDVLVELLHKYDLVTALDGKTALHILKEEGIDLVLLDVMMPDMDGFSVCKAIKEDAKTFSIPVLFLSARNMPQDIQKGFEVGGIDYITKPFQAQELLARVQTHLKLSAFEKDLQAKIKEEIQKNRLQEQIINQQSKQVALGELLMHIAHQWKQPLAALSSINMLNIINLEQEKKVSKESLLQKYHKSEVLISFMSDTIETFRNFYVPNKENTNFFIHEAIQKVLTLLQVTLDYHDISVDVKTEVEEEIFANESEFMQVLFSLLSNSINILHQRKITHPEITITLTKKSIIIEDNGEGIESSILATLFDPFSSTTGGDGIGLYIAKEILRKNSAIINAQNGLHGAIFTIEFLTWLD